MKRVKFYPELIAIVAAACLTRLWNLFTPAAVVFDEVYFKAFAGHYLDGRYFFDIHPPLAKLLLAGWAYLLGLSPDTVLDGTALEMRILPAIAGILIIPVFWGILRRLGANRTFAALGACLLILENSLLVESRFILTDTMLLLFGLSAIWFYLCSRHSSPSKRWIWLMLAALSGGAAAATKWTGLTALAIVGITWIIDSWPLTNHYRRRLGELAILIVVPIAVYVFSFWLHFALLPKTGDGDAFMSSKFQSTLIGSTITPKQPMNFIAKFSELNVEMYKANQTLTATHPYASRWYTWPLELRPIYYWQGDTLANGRQGNIYLLGNPFIWWSIPLAIISGALLIAWKRWSLTTNTKASLWFLALAYFINFAPFMAVTRVMFLYHYFYSFIFSLAAAIILWQAIASHYHPAIVRRWVVIVGLLATISFLYFAPLTYGTPLTPQDLMDHMWLKSWR